MFELSDTAVAETGDSLDVNRPVTPNTLCPQAFAHTVSAEFREAGSARTDQDFACRGRSCRPTLRILVSQS